MDECYLVIANAQRGGRSGSIAEITCGIEQIGTNEKERFFVGVYFGRIIQVNEAALEGNDAFISEHLAQLDKAADKLKEHPEIA